MLLFMKLSSRTTRRLITLGGPGSGPRPGQRPVEFDEDAHKLKPYRNAPDNRRNIMSVAGAKGIRDKLQSQGRLNPDGRTVSIYHVTTPENTDSILKHGLVPGASEAPGQDWKAAHSEYGTYFHQDRGVALRDAKEIGGHVIEARVPITPKALLRFVPDEDTGRDKHDYHGALLSGEAVSYVGGIPHHALSKLKQ